MPIITYSSLHIGLDFNFVQQLMEETSIEVSICGRPRTTGLLEYVRRERTLIPVMTRQRRWREIGKKLRWHV